MSALRKIQVTRGVYWIEAPEADLRLLCGCPADVIKHLMRRGLILPTEIKGVACETGPNAILLSDIMVQGGAIANMAEFPVLQMLYRQGMLLPNHPNNTGQKPLLIGNRAQIEAQSAYIYRGNYGLVSEQEMRDAGLSDEEAAERMRIKLKFAFGRIRPTRDFLETRFLEKEPVEIRGGVKIRRMNVNLFEISHQNETLLVDLNLSAYERYLSPYPLGFHNIRGEYFSIIHSGNGDGWDINQPCMSSILVYQGRKYLVDAGPNMVETMLALGIGINEVEGIFHTHSHDDHFAGLTSLIRGDRRLKYYATPLVRASVTHKLTALLGMEPEDFATYFDVHDLVEDQWNDIHGLEVMPLPSPHPVETTVFYFRTLSENGYRIYAHLADITAVDLLERMVGDSAQGGLSQEGVARVKEWYGWHADVKKLDVGGGMIHGRAEDFRSDPSQRVILSHIGRPLTPAEKEIGSGAPFGSCDVLIPDYQNYLWRYAFDFLTTYFPMATPHQLKILLNNHVVTFNPEALILKEGAIATHIHLLLTGNVEVMQGGGAATLLYAGSILGEMSGIYQLPSSQTYRAASYVQALSVPVNLYVAFVHKNDLYAQIERLQERRDLLQKSWLFGEGISYATQNRIAQEMTLMSLAKGEPCPVQPGAILLLSRGRLERYLGEDFVEMVEEREFCGEESALHDTPSLFTLRAQENSSGYWIPAAILKEVPIVRWKLFESHGRRMQKIMDLGASGEVEFRWRSLYSVHVPMLDEHHRKLFEAGARFAAALRNQERQAAEEALNFLIAYTRFHFDAEEALMRERGYIETEEHVRKHHKLMEQVVQLQEHLEEQEYQTGTDFLNFFKGWIVNHILTEDRKIAASY